MGNGFAKLSICFTGEGGARRRQDISVLISDPLDEGASVSANTSTPLSTAFVDLYSYNSIDRASAFESSTSFTSIPLQPIPRNWMNSGPIPGSYGGIPGSGPLERGFLSGPIERGFMSGPIDRGLFSGPLEKSSTDQFQRSYSHGGFAFRPRSRKGSLIRVLQRAISKTISRGQNSIVAPIKGVVSVKEPDWLVGSEKHNENLTVSSVNLSSDGSLEDDDSLESQNLQWAQGKAGEDRVHVVVSEEHGWHESNPVAAPASSPVPSEASNSELEDSHLGSDVDLARNRMVDGCSHCSYQEYYPSGSGDVKFDSNSKRKKGKNSKNKYKGAAKKWEENQRRWKYVLKALSQALRKTEESYLEIADKMVMENPELALMGSCVLVMLMKGEDVYVMNVGDSRAVLAQKAEADVWLGKIRQDLERINEETLHDLEAMDNDNSNMIPTLSAFQLTVDHSTSVEEEVRRIKNEHPDDACAVMNDRVKGSLKVTRAFGAGFLKQPKWNNALLEMFRIDYVGTSPYISCLPSLYHHRLGPEDRFLILSSDGLYQYMTNEEAVSEVELFIALSPDGDPAQHLVEEVLFRAAKKAGMDFHELLEIPQGDRRRYHDDVSIIVISLEGMIWRSCV
ncbi:putative protein phosphatase 2C 4 [Vitis vinifera]|uniref:PPM-type phosphatase domain-containing protein n=1 Tax=Vitis vinifera TaxID=29760 RepID=A0A438G147_VITVI|nr:putative protein phosphatase 2C 4 [Vitis vinifera]